MDIFLLVTGICVAFGVAAFCIRAWEQDRREDHARYRLNNRSVSSGQGQSFARNCDKCGTTLLVPVGGIDDYWCPHCQVNRPPEQERMNMLH